MKRHFANSEPLSRIVSQVGSGCFFYYCAFFSLIIGSTLASTAQTNSPLPERWFVLPTPHLRTVMAEPAKPEVLQPKVSLVPLTTASDRTVPKSQFSDSFSVNTACEDTDFDPRYRNFVLKKLTDLEPRDRVTRGFESVFSPEEFRVGRKAKISCTITTAIKRKDPLCLLNTKYFFRFSW